MTKLGRRMMNSDLGRRFTNSDLGRRFTNSTRFGRSIVSVVQPRVDSQAARDADRIGQPMEMRREWEPGPTEIRSERRSRDVANPTRETQRLEYDRNLKERQGLPPLPSGNVAGQRTSENSSLADFPSAPWERDSYVSSFDKDLREDDDRSTRSSSSLGSSSLGAPASPANRTFKERTGAEIGPYSDSHVPSDVAYTPPLSPQAPGSQFAVELPDWWPQEVGNKLSGITERTEEDEISLNGDAIHVSNAPDPDLLNGEEILFDYSAKYVGEEEVATISDHSPDDFLDLRGDNRSFIDPFESSSVSDVGGSNSSVFDSDYSSYLETESSVTKSSFLDDFSFRDVGGSKPPVIDSGSSFSERNVSELSLNETSVSEIPVSEISDSDTYFTAESTGSGIGRLPGVGRLVEDDWGDKIVADGLARGNDAAAKHDRDVESPEGRRAVIQRHLEERQKEKAGRGNESSRERD